MLDFDLAELYEVETRTLNQAVKRNFKRFPSDFMFQLSNKEFDNLMSQIVISSWGGNQHAVQRHLSGLDRNGKPKRKKSKANETDRIFGVRKIRTKTIIAVLT